MNQNTWVAGTKVLPPAGEQIVHKIAAVTNQAAVSETMVIGAILCHRLDHWKAVRGASFLMLTDAESANGHLDYSPTSSE